MPTKLPSSFFFKEFNLSHHNSTMKIGTDAVLLGAWVKGLEEAKVLEVGTGCGIIALMMAQRGARMVDAIDIDLLSTEEASLNFGSSQWSEKLRVFNISLQAYEGIEEKYSLIVSNPPYFNKHLQSADSKRSLARHAKCLPFSDLSIHAYRLGTEDVKAAFVIAFDMFEVFSLEFASAGWYLHRRQDVVSCFGKIPSLVLSEWGKTPQMVESMPILNLKQTDEEWHSDYRNLTSDFYPHF